MRTKHFLIALCLHIGAASAQTTSQTLCFVSNKNKHTELVLRIYLDEEIQKEVGALAKYSTSNKSISLAYIDDGATDDSVDYELHWLEIYGGKITGEYRLLKPKMATIQGAYVKYRSLKTGQETVFIPSEKSGSDCVISRDR